MCNHDATVTGGKGGTIERHVFTEWLRTVVLLGLMPLDSIDRDVSTQAPTTATCFPGAALSDCMCLQMRSESSSMLRRLEPALGDTDAAERLTQQLCVELEIGQSGSFTLDEFSVAVDKLDFESWDLLADDIRAELGEHPIL